MNPLIKLTNQIPDSIESQYPNPVYDIYKEYWAPITNIGLLDIREGLYYISTYGRVISFARNTPIFLNQVLSNKGYFRVFLQLNKGGGLYKSVHRIELRTFFPTIDMDKLDVNHKNGITTYNYIWNLEWTTRKENINHSIYTLNHPRTGERNGSASISDYQAEQICQLLNQNIPRKDIADIVGCSIYNINNIVSGNCRNEIAEKYGISVKIPNRFTKNDVHSICKFLKIISLNINILEAPET